MTEFTKYILLAVILLVFLLLFVPKTEYFESIANNIIQQNEKLRKSSTILYTNPEYSEEDDFLNNLADENHFPTEPMFMNRCIEFTNNPSLHLNGIDQTIYQLRKDKRFFISNKITIEYVDYSTIQEKLKHYILTLYAHTNDPKNPNAIKVHQFYGPAYALITQYPYLRTIRRDGRNQCDILTIPLQQSNVSESIGYSPKLQDNTPSCDIQRDTISSKLIVCEVYLLFPAHDVGMVKQIDLPNGKKGTINTVGPYKYKTWANIKCNMRRLFAYNSDMKIAGLSVVNPRSQDPKCFVKCGQIGNSYGYTCGARNAKGKKPYESIVLSSIKTQTEGAKLHDYANLYLLNSSIMNNLLGVNTKNGIFADCINVQAIERTFTSQNMSSLCENIKTPISGPTDKLEQVAKSVFIISFINKNLSTNWCVGVDFNKKTLVPLLSNGNIRAISWESTPISIYTSLTVKDTFYFLSINIPNNKNKYEKWWLMSNNRLVQATTNNIPDIAFYPRRAKLQFVMFTKRGSRYEIRPNFSSCLTLLYVNGSYTIRFEDCAVQETTTYVTTVSFMKITDKGAVGKSCPTISDSDFENNLKSAEYYYKNPVI